MQAITGTSARKGFATVFGVVAATLAAAVGVVLAVVFAATIVVIGFMGSILLALAGLAMKARRTAKAMPHQDGVIEARRIGGHSWVAYGWDQRSR
jgi:hypothetical protein